MRVLRIGSKKTLTRWIRDKGCPNVLEGAKISEIAKWYKKHGKEGNGRHLANKEYQEFSKFMGFSVEFTELCKPDSIKFVVPYWQDVTIGNAIEYDTKKKTMFVRDNMSEADEFIHDADIHSWEACSLMPSMA